MAAVELTPASRDVRRRVGPMAWAVLEDLVLDARVDEHGVVVAGSSARQVAANLGVEPGTAARALRRLRDEGFVVLVREAGSDGRFGLSAYQLAEIAGLTITACDSPCVVQPQMVGPRTVEPSAVDQAAAIAHEVEPTTTALAGPVVEAPSRRGAVDTSPVRVTPTRAGSRQAGRAKPAKAVQPSLWETT
jgi:DNA-binding transcriptional ArsR family regulator